MAKRTSFIDWLTGEQPITLPFVHIILGCVAVSLATDRPTPPWDVVGWVFTILPFVMYWCGNYWYWAVNLQHGTKC